MMQKQVGDKLYATDINELWAAANPKQSTSNGQAGKNFPGTRATNLTKRPVEWWWGKLVADSFTDNRYTVVSVKRTNTNNDNKDAAGKWEAYDEDDVYYKKITAKNVGEDKAKTHGLEAGTLVQVYEEADAGSPPTTRYTFDMSSAKLPRGQYGGMVLQQPSQNDEATFTFPFGHAML